MRITQNHIAKQLIADVKAISKSDDVRGKLILGKITALSDGWLTINTESASLVVKNAQKNTMHLGDLVTIELLGKDNEGHLIGKVIDQLTDQPTGQPIDKPIEKSDENTLIKTYIDKLNLLPNERNVAIVEALLKNDVPVTQNTVHQLQQSQIEIKTLLNELPKLTQEQENQLLSKLEEPLKRIVMDLIKPSPPAPVEAIAKQVEPLQHTVPKESGLLPVLLQLSQEAENKPVEDVIKEIVTEFDLSMDVSRIKNAFELTLKNMVLIHNLLNQNVRVEDAFQKVAHVFKEIPLTAEQTHSVLELLANKTTESEKIESLIVFLEKELPDTVLKDDALKELFFIKDNLNLQRADQVVQGWIPLPIEFEDNKEQVRVYLKNRDQKNTSDDHTVLVALNTKHFGEVRCVVELHDKQFKLNFILSTEAIKNQFQAKESLLKAALKTIGRDQVLIRYKTKDETINEDKPLSIVEATNIDVKI